MITRGPRLVGREAATGVMHGWIRELVGLLDYPEAGGILPDARLSKS
jgi:hypothetical protein